MFIDVKSDVEVHIRCVVAYERVKTIQETIATEFFLDFFGILCGFFLFPLLFLLRHNLHVVDMALSRVEGSL